MERNAEQMECEIRNRGSIETRQAELSRHRITTEAENFSDVRQWFCQRTFC